MITGAWLLISLMLPMIDKTGRVWGSERKQSYCLTGVIHLCKNVDISFEL